MGLTRASYVNSPEMSHNLSFRPGAFDMVSRVGRQIDEKLNSREVFEQLTQRRRHPQNTEKGRERRLLPPQKLIEMLNQQQMDEAEAQVAEKPKKPRSEEDFVFRRQSRQDFYRSTVLPSQQKGEIVPPVGYYDPNFKSVEKASLNTSWAKRPKRTQKPLSLDEGAMKLGADRKFPVKATLSFDKQLPRKNSLPHLLAGDYSRGSSLTDRVMVWDWSKGLKRPEAFPGTKEGNPDYQPNYNPVWKRVARDLFFAKTPGRKSSSPSVNDLVYENISYTQVKPKVPAPCFSPSKVPRDTEQSPFPLFMRNLTSWQSAASINEKTLQLSGAFSGRNSQKERNGVHTAASSPTKRRDVHARSSSLASLT